MGATHTPVRRELSKEKASRIVDAMRASVAERGVAASTFDHVARAAGVSRGLLHYYFGTKERLLAEVVQRDCDLRMALMAGAINGARTADEVIDAMVAQLRDLVEHDPGFMALIFELATTARRTPELAAEWEAVLRRGREHLAGLLQAKADEGVLVLRDDAEAIASILFALGDGLAMRMLAEPGRDFAGEIRAGTTAVRALLGPS